MGFADSNNDKSAYLKEAVRTIESLAFSRGNYRSNINISPCGARAWGEIRRGELMNLICWGPYSMCCCPYNVWGLKLYFDGDQRLMREVSKKVSSCTTCCFSGWIGLMVINSQYKEFRTIVGEALVQAQRNVGNQQQSQQQPQPQFGAQFEYTVPSAPPPTYNDSAFAAPTVQAIHVPDYSGSGDVPIATAYVVEDLSATSYNDCPSYSDAMGNDTWLKQGI